MIAPAVPLRLISVEGGSGFETSAKGLLPFEISREPVDRLRAEIAIEIEPELSYWDPKHAAAAKHVVVGLYEDGWMTGQATMILKTPESPKAMSVTFFIPADAPARRMEMLVDGRGIAAADFDKPGAYSLAAPFTTTEASVELTLRVDATHTVPPDARDLGVIVTGAGFR